MIVNITTLTFELKILNSMYGGFFTFKSADCILFLDMIGTFFVFKKVITRCRSPPLSI